MSSCDHQWVFLAYSYVCGTIITYKIYKCTICGEEKKERSCQRDFGNIDPDDETCVPRCPRFEDCFNEHQRRARREPEK